LHACVNHSSMRATVASRVTGLGQSPGRATRCSPTRTARLDRAKIKQIKIIKISSFS
jgi:hypothetical protein